MGVTAGQVGRTEMGPVQDVPVVYLDIDGVLHPLGEPAIDDSFRLIDNPGLFRWAPILEAALAPYPEMKIVVSSDWRRIFDDPTLAMLLGCDLGSRMLGSVEVVTQSRADEVRMDAERRGLVRWLAIDDHPSVVEAHRLGDTRFVVCRPDQGLSEPRVQQELHRRILLMIHAGGRGRRLGE